MKPGYKTTEFYGMIAVLITGALVLFQIIEPGEHEELERAIAELIGAGAVIVANAAVAIQYIKARTELKQTTGGGNA